MLTLSKTEKDLITLFTEEQIQARIREIADEINKEFANCSELVVIGVLYGSVLFVSDLIKHIKIPVQLEFIRVSSYGTAQVSSGKVESVDLTLPNLESKNVLIVEDIVDTGLTARFLLDYINLRNKAGKIKFASLLDKKCARLKPVKIDYIGFEIEDKFVVGYGLDYIGFFRNLPYIGYFD